MSEKREKLKVQRNRKRIYETSVEGDSLKEETPGVALSNEAVEAVESCETASAESASPTAISDEPVVDFQLHDALTLVRKYSAWAAGAGLVPMPVFDMVAIMAVQIAMLKKLSELYGIQFSEQRSKAAVAALIGGVNAGYLGGSALKMFPLFGVLSLFAMPTVNWAITYAVGRVFIQHFATGGTFLDFDPAAVKAFFEEQYKEGKLQKTQSK